MDSFVDRLPAIVMQLMAFALALSLHEAAHGWMAERLGDPTARWLGRITLNPIKHVDPFGTIVFPLVLAAIGAPVLGWAKPVPFVTRNLRNQRWGPALVGLAGPASNIALGLAVTLVLLLAKGMMPGFRPLLVVLLREGAMGAGGVVAPLVYLLFALAMINLILAVFNLIPIPPLDGSHILEAVLPARAAYGYAQLRPYGMFILLALFWSGLFGRVLNPFVNGLLWILLR
ncbi:MAG TPA: site-2 protease family protein [Thermoanaerobaculaceae bacterium]|nr:site-2 protease family protein [Thermoanaerobaculaceae bacterium]HRS16606.1 site-2 protease family protein [Thermoanaerobaculaceae bacterium]